MSGSSHDQVLFRQAQITVCLIDPDDLYRRQMEHSLDEIECIELLGSYRDSEAAGIEILSKGPALILINSLLIAIGRGRMLRWLKCNLPKVRVVVILGSNAQNNCIQDCLSAGADGFLERDSQPSAEVLRQNLLEAYRGLYPLTATARCFLIEAYRGHGHNGASREELTLTPREIQIAEFWAQGLTDKQIANKLNISFETVKTHAKNLFSKLNAHNKAEACCKLWQRHQGGATENCLPKIFPHLRDSKAFRG